MALKLQKPFNPKFIQYPDPKLKLTEDQLLPIQSNTLPSDFCFFEMQGESVLKSNILISHSINKEEKNYLMILNYRGEVLWYKKALDHPTNLFKKYTNSLGKPRYTYFQFTGKTLGRGIFLYELVVMNEYFEEIDRIRVFDHGGLPVNSYLTHDYLCLDDGRYVIIGIFLKNGVVEFAVQEVEEKRLVFHWQSDDHPELRKLSIDDRLFGDYIHPNSIALDEEGNYLLSLRFIGLMKIRKTDGRILWIIGSKRNDFLGIPFASIPFNQHDARLTEDGSITVWDNKGHGEDHSRIMRYYLDEQNMICTKIKEYVYSKEVGSKTMGGAQILDEGKEIFGLTFGDNYLVQPI